MDGRLFNEVVIEALRGRLDDVSAVVRFRSASALFRHGFQETEVAFNTWILLRSFCSVSVFSVYFDFSMLVYVHLNLSIYPLPYPQVIVTILSELAAGPESIRPEAAKLLSELWGSPGSRDLVLFNVDYSPPRKTGNFPETAVLELRRGLLHGSEELKYAKRVIGSDSLERRAAVPWPNLVFSIWCSWPTSSPCPPMRIPRNARSQLSRLGLQFRHSWLGIYRNTGFVWSEWITRSFLTL